MIITRLKFCLILIVISVASIGVTSTGLAFADQNTTQTNPVFQVVIVYSPTPAQDLDLARYNEAVNFEKLKQVILESSDPNAALQNILNDLNKQSDAINVEWKTNKRYNSDGSLTMEYSNLWMKTVTTHSVQGNINRLLEFMDNGMSLQTAISQIDPTMRLVIAEYEATPKTKAEKQADDMKSKKEAIMKKLESKWGIPIKTELDATYPDALQIDLDEKPNYLQISKDAKDKALNGRIVSDLPDDPQLDLIRIRQTHVMIQTFNKLTDHLEQQKPKLTLTADGKEKPEITEINKKIAEIRRYTNFLSKIQDVLYKGASYEAAKSKIGFDVDKMSIISINSPSTPTPTGNSALDFKVTIAKGSYTGGCDKTNSCYSPYEAKISVNGKITWKNEDSQIHTVTNPDGLFDSSKIAAGKSFSYTFTKSGKADYYCIVHPWMKGVIIVGDSMSPLTSSSMTPMQEQPVKELQSKTGTLEKIKTMKEKNLEQPIIAKEKPSLVKEKQKTPTSKEQVKPQEKVKIAKTDTEKAKELKKKMAIEKAKQKVKERIAQLKAKNSK